MGGFRRGSRDDDLFLAARFVARIAHEKTYGLTADKSGVGSGQNDQFEPIVFHLLDRLDKTIHVYGLGDV